MQLVVSDRTVLVEGGGGSDEGENDSQALEARRAADSVSINDVEASPQVSGRRKGEESVG